MGVATLFMIFILVLMLGVFQHYISTFVSWITKQVFKDSQEIVKLKDELKALTEEQSLLDMKEEFPKYARLGRRKTKIQEQLKAMRQSKTTGTLTFSWGLTLLLNIIHTACLILVIWRHRHVELIKLNPDWFWPIANLVAFPTGISGAVGITCWVLISNVVLRRLTRLKSTLESQKLHQS